VLRREQEHARSVVGAHQLVVAETGLQHDLACLAMPPDEPHEVRCVGAIDAEVANETRPGPRRRHRRPGAEQDLVRL
jgi:hypothetical protein